MFINKSNSKVYFNIYYSKFLKHYSILLQFTIENTLYASFFYSLLLYKYNCI